MCSYNVVERSLVGLLILFLFFFPIVNICRSRESTILSVIDSGWKVMLLLLLLFLLLRSISRIRLLGRVLSGIGRCGVDIPPFPTIDGGGHLLAKSGECWATFRNVQLLPKIPGGYPAQGRLPSLVKSSSAVHCNRNVVTVSRNWLYCHCAQQLKFVCSRVCVFQNRATYGDYNFMYLIKRMKVKLICSWLFQMMKV